MTPLPTPLPEGEGTERATYGYPQLTLTRAQHAAPLRSHNSASATGRNMGAGRWLALNDKPRQAGVCHVMQDYFRYWPVRSASMRLSNGGCDINSSLNDLDLPLMQNAISVPASCGS